MATPFQTTGTQEGDIAAGLISGGIYNPNIPASDIQPTTPLKLPEPSLTPDYKSIIAGLSGSLPPPTDTTTIDKNQADILALMKEQGGQSAFAAQQADIAGVGVDKKALADLQAQLNAVNTEAQVSNLNVDRMGRETILTSQANIEKTNIERDRTIKALRLSSSIQAMQGNLQLAQEQVDRAVALKYDPIKSQLEILNKQLDFNYKTFDASEKRRADALKAQNDLKIKALDIQIANEKDKNATLLNQMQTYPDAGITINDTLESANLKITTRSKIYADKIRAPQGPEGSGPGTKGFKNAKTESEVRDNAQTFIDEVDAGNMTIEKAYEKLRRLYSQDEASDDALKELLGIVPPPPENSYLKLPPPKTIVQTVTGTQTGVLGALNRAGVAINNWFRGL